LTFPGYYQCIAVQQILESDATLTAQDYPIGRRKNACVVGENGCLACGHGAQIPEPAFTYISGAIQYQD
jgi:hypothetical protein